MRYPPRTPRPLRPCAALVLAAATALGWPALVGADPTHFKVVVNEDCPATELSREQVSRLFLGKASAWPDGTRAEPVDQPEGSAVREAFTQAVHRRSLAAVKMLWQHAIFSGRGVPPPEVSGDAAVLAHVRSHPGGLGYVSAAAVPEGARVLQVKD